MSECTHDCSTCSENCADRQPGSFQKSLREGASVKKVIAVVSGKGGVGKSLVTCLMASEMQRRGYNCAVLDADITGPSIPRSFGIHEHCFGTEEYLIPVRTHTGLQIMSINLILEPPGTGDVPLTVFQSLPVDGIVIVTSPQDLVGMIVEKAVNMADLLHVPVIGLVENMSYFKCPDCGKEHAIFGESKVEALSKHFNIPNAIRLPIDPVISTMVDAGEVESVSGEYIGKLVDAIEKGN